MEDVHVIYMGRDVHKTYTPTGIHLSNMYYIKM